MHGPTQQVDRSRLGPFAEKRLFIETERGTRYIRLSPLSQIAMAASSLALAGWMTVASTAFVLDHLGERAESGGAAALSEAAEARFRALGAERDAREAEARSAQIRFRIALDELGQKQGELLRSVEEKRELAAALDVMRQRLADVAGQRDLARAETETLRGQVAEVTDTLASAGAADLAETLETVAAALGEAVRVRDEALAERDDLRIAVADAERRIAAVTERNEAMVAELEYAVRTSFKPLEGLFKAADLDLDHVLATVRRDYSGTGGGPRSSVRMSTRSVAGIPEPTDERFDQLLVDLDRMNMLRIAAGRIPYTMPVMADHRFTSGFGYRRDPKNGRRRMHAGIDLAAPKGTPIYATAEGVVVSSGFERGYGYTVRIRHDFGFETLYAHNSNIRVRVGQQVSRGDHISDMGATGRATGVHLHYEVRLNGQPVNPMVYLEAARDVF